MQQGALEEKEKGEFWGMMGVDTDVTTPLTSGAVARLLRHST